MRILLLDIDSLRPDHLGCYGYQRNTSPNIDNLAKSSVVFTNCFASDTPCLPSRTALAMGRFGMKSGVNTHNGPGQMPRRYADGHRFLPGLTPTFALLGEEMRTVSISSFSYRHKAFWFSGSFRETYNPVSFGNGLETANQVTPVAIDWLERNGQEDNWLLHINYWDVHHPYPITKEQASVMKNEGQAQAWPDEEVIAQHRIKNGVRTPGQWNAIEDEELMRKLQETNPRIGSYPMPFTIDHRADLDYLLDGYDASIRIVDEHIQILINQLDKCGVLDDTIIILTGDHGDAFGEHGIYAEHALAHPATQHVPLIVRFPGGHTGYCDELMYQFDIMATLVEARNKEIPDGWDARSVFGVLQGGEYAGPPYLVCTHGSFTFSRSVVTKDWLYIRTLHPGLFDFPREMLHHRHEDPFCETNLADQEPIILQQMAKYLSEWQYENGTRLGLSDPLVDSMSVGPFIYGALEPYIERLKSNDDQEKLERLKEQLTPLGIKLQY